MKLTRLPFIAEQMLIVTVVDEAYFGVGAVLLSDHLHEAVQLAKVGQSSTARLCMFGNDSNCL